MMYKSIGEYVTHVLAAIDVTISVFKMSQTEKPILSDSAIVSSHKIHLFTVQARWEKYCQEMGIEGEAKIQMGKAMEKDFERLLRIYAGVQQEELRPKHLIRQYKDVEKPYENG